MKSKHDFVIIFWISFSLTAEENCKMVNILDFMEMSFTIFSWFDTVIFIQFLEYLDSILYVRGAASDNFWLLSVRSE